MIEFLYRHRVKILTALLVINIAFSGMLGYMVFDLNSTVSELDEGQDTMTDYLLNYPSGNGSVHTATATRIDTKEDVMLAYNGQTGSGTLITYEFRPLPTKDVYIGTTYIAISRDMQRSFSNARAAVEHSKFEPEMEGFVITPSNPKNWAYIEGESASLSVARMMAATDPDYERNESVVLTGRLTDTGGVKSVQHVTEKANAAREAGYDKMVAPRTIGEVRVDGIEVVQVRYLEDALNESLDPVSAK